ncbi:uncharacterized protein [Coffea arabica]|uniref:Uncharacterized protein n=1 Tax=Coffea arabica TaxID=13443 RepID=A0A6P6VTF9_COFAR|nr:uncharacterized protein LOC113726390 [Coffea arabica]
MASYQVIIALFFTLALARIELSTSNVLRGSVTCLDCDGHNDLSGIKIVVKCSNVKMVDVATTKKDGTFETELAKGTTTSPNSLKCLAKILGGPSLLYTSGKKTISKVEKVEGHDYYTNTEPLNFYKSCPAEKHAECASVDLEFGSSKTVDLPLPREWGLAPSSYYVPFIPIIGIP